LNLSLSSHLLTLKGLGIYGFFSRGRLKCQKNLKGNYQVRLLNDCCENAIKKGLKRLGYFLFFSLAACQRESPWAVSQIQTGNKAFDSSRLSYFSKDKINGIDLEWIQTETELYCYLQVHSHAIQNPQVTLIIGDEKEQFSCPRHRGGQRLLLPEELKQKILSALEAGSSLTLTVDDYRVTLEPTDFRRSFKKMQKPLSFLKRFSL
jgi:hypothetical protein